MAGDSLGGGRDAHDSFILLEARAHSSLMRVVWLWLAFCVPLRCCSQLLGRGLLVQRVELADEVIDLVNSDFALVVFVEHAEHGLVLLLVNCKLLVLLLLAASRKVMVAQQAGGLQLHAAARGVPSFTAELAAAEV